MFIYIIKKAATTMLQLFLCVNCEFYQQSIVFYDKIILIYAYEGEAMDKEKIGIFIATLRKEQNLTQKQLADKICLTDKAISKWERGISYPDIAMLEPLAETLNVSILELLKGERLKQDELLSSEEAKKLIENSIVLSDEEMTRKHKRSKMIILFFIMLFMLLVSIGLNVVNYLIL